MPRYYFSVHDADGEARDVEGVEFPNLDAAKIEAIKGGRSIMSDSVRRGELDLAAYIEILSQDQEVLCRVSFADLLSIRT